MKIAIITSNTGVDKAELEAPLTALQEAGWEFEHLATEAGDVQTMVADVDKDAVHQATGTIVDADPDAFDGLIIPGGTVNADHLRMDTDASTSSARSSRRENPSRRSVTGPGCWSRPGCWRARPSRRSRR